MAPAPPPRGPHAPGRRAGRFHTARGPMGLSGWLRLPAALLRARLGRVPERPWIVPAAVGWLGRRARRDWRVLELGSGRSTVWLARRAGSVLSFEDNEHWLARAQELLVAAGVENAEVRHLPVEHLAAEVEAMPDESFDLVVIDFLESPEADRVEARPRRPRQDPAGRLPAARRLGPARLRRGLGAARRLARAPLQRRQGRVARGLRDGDLPAAAEVERGPASGASSVASL